MVKRTSTWVFALLFCSSLTNCFWKAAAVGSRADASNTDVSNNETTVMPDVTEDALVSDEEASVPDVVSMNETAVPDAMDAGAETFDERLVDATIESGPDAINEVGADNVDVQPDRPDVFTPPPDIIDVVPPPDTAPPAAIFTAIAAGGAHTCGIAMGGIYCWGSNTQGQLARPVSTAPQTRPVRTAMSITNPTAIRAGNAHTCAIGNGAVFCWGSNEFGQLGMEPMGTPRSETPVLINTGLMGVNRLFVGGNAAYACNASSCVSWGANESAQRGTAAPSVIEAANFMGIPVSLSLGDRHTCATYVSTSDCPDMFPTPRCWGSNGQNQLGHPSFPSSPAPYNVPVGGGICQQSQLIAAGKQHSCGHDSTMGLYCWGSNSNGQLGLTASGTVSDPTLVMGLSTETPTALALGDAHSCALIGSSVYCWGNNSVGQLGRIAATNTHLPRPVAFSNTTTAPSFITAGSNHTCAMTPAGAFCWGANSSGQLGDGTTRDQTIPVQATW